MPHAIEVSKVDFHYGPKKALDQISLYVVPKSITAFIGPSGCGKSTLLRCFNRMNDRIPGAKITSGEMRINGVDIARPEIDLELLRRDVGMVFQKYNPFPMSIFENVAYGLRIRGEKSKSVIRDRVEESLRAAVLWEECKDRLKTPALGLSGGQQQRLCIARAIAVKPEILLMDEPCAALDPLSTLKIEELMQSLRHDFTIVIVTHNMQQARRCSDQTGFFHMGKLIEIAPTLQLFGNPRERKTEEYLAGRFS